MTLNGQSRPHVLEGCDVLPPMDDHGPAPARKPKPAKASRPKRKRSSAGRFQSINAFIDVTMARLAPAQRAVWFILWRDTKPTGLAGTSQASLARRAGVSDRAVRSALRVLEQAGLVIVVRRGSLRRGPSTYRVHPLRRQP
jgi:hypothetical protein